MMLQLFNILEKVDSSNNYAMAKVHEGMARHGMAWFALQQISGKGQRGKIWISPKGENIILSVAVQPPGIFEVSKFYFNALIAVTVRNFVQDLVSPPVYIKWPNDIFFSDKKAGGILIENLVNSVSWKWAVVGIGLNINQQNFEENLNTAISVFQITNNKQDIEELAKKLQLKLVEAIDNFSFQDKSLIITEYNKYLYKRNTIVTLKDSNGLVEAFINDVDENGILSVKTDKETSYRFGEIEWIL